MASKERNRGGREASDVTESDLASHKMGDNKLQGNDQRNVRNQRHAVPEQKTETDGVIESLEKLDKDVRARRDLNKGQGTGRS